MSNNLPLQKNDFSDSSKTKLKGVFAALPKAMRSKLLENKITHIFDENQYMQHGDQDLGLWYMHKGHARVGRRGENGAFQPLLIISEGDSFGELTCFADNHAPIEGVAIGEVEAYWVSREELHEAIAIFPESNILIQEIVASQLLQALDIILLTRLQDSSEKLRWNLRYFCSYKKAPIPLPLSQGELADMVGISRMTISKELKHLEDLGILERKYGKMHIIKPELLMT